MLTTMARRARGTLTLPLVIFVLGSLDRLFALRLAFLAYIHRGIPASLCATHNVLFKGLSKMDIFLRGLL